MYDATSNGQTCETSPTEPSPAEEYMDEEGCYNSITGNKMCPTPEGECPNEFTVGGVRYCEQPGDGDDGGGDDGGGDDGGGDGGSGDDDDSEECEPDPDSENDCGKIPDLPTPEDCTTADECVSYAVDRIKATPLVSSIGSIAGIVGEGGSCPVLSIDLSAAGWGNLQTNLHCDVATQISGTLAAIMMIFWVVVGIRIFASA
jgi:hypothetical protein